jgi:hypothetical protein
LRREQQPFRQSAWEIRWLRRDEDALVGLSYRPMHAEFMSAADSFTQAMRHDFAEAWSRQSNSQAPNDRVDSLERRGNNVTSFARASVRMRSIAVALPDVLEQMQSPPRNAKNKACQMTANFDVPASAGLRRFWRAPSKHF